MKLLNAIPEEWGWTYSNDRKSLFRGCDCCLHELVLRAVCVTWELASNLDFDVRGNECKYGIGYQLV